MTTKNKQKHIDWASERSTKGFISHGGFYLFSKKIQKILNRGQSCLPSLYHLDQTTLHIISTQYLWTSFSCLIKQNKKKKTQLLNRKIWIISMTMHCTAFNVLLYSKFSLLFVISSKVIFYNSTLFFTSMCLRHVSVMLNKAVGVPTSEVNQLYCFFLKCSQCPVWHSHGHSSTVPSSLCVWDVMQTCDPDGRLHHIVATPGLFCCHQPVTAERQLLVVAGHQVPGDGAGKNSP